MEDLVFRDGDRIHNLADVDHFDQIKNADGTTFALRLSYRGGSQAFFPYPKSVEVLTRIARIPLLRH